MTLARTLDPPRDRTIEVHVRDGSIWLRVKWDVNGVTEVDGLATVTGRWEGRERERSSFWLGPDDIDAWREPRVPPLKVPPLRPSPAWDVLASKLLDMGAAAQAPDATERAQVLQLLSAAGGKAEAGVKSPT